MNPTEWTIGHIIPAHTKELHEKYVQKLGIVTMEGREAKHIALKKLSENTFYNRGWYEIFKHEFVMLVWLPEQGFNHSTYTCTSILLYTSQTGCFLTQGSAGYCSLVKASPTDEKIMYKANGFWALTTTLAFPFLGP